MAKKKIQKKAKKKMGAKPKVIDWDRVDKMMAIQCTGEEIAGILAIDYDTLVSHIKKKFRITYSEYFEQKRSAGKMSLRRRQFAMAETVPTMAIWLGKQYLKQTDSSHVDHTSKGDKIDQNFTFEVVDENKNK